MKAFEEQRKADLAAAEEQRKADLAAAEEQRKADLTAAKKRRVADLSAALAAAQSNLLSRLRTEEQKGPSFLNECMGKFVLSPHPSQLQKCLHFLQDKVVGMLICGNHLLSIIGLISDAPP